MVYVTSAAANVFLSTAWSQGKHVDPMKLQKLVYFTHGWYLAYRQGASLFREHAEAWAYGPVFPRLYHAVKGWGAGPILQYVTFIAEDPVRQPLDHLALTNIQQDTFEMRLLLRVWDLYGGLSGLQLSELTHDPNGPWWQTRRRSTDYGTVIPNPLIRTYFQEKLNTDARRRQAPATTTATGS